MTTPHYLGPWNYHHETRKDVANFKYALAYWREARARCQAKHSGCANKPQGICSQALLKEQRKILLNHYPAEFAKRIIDQQIPQTEQSRKWDTL